MMRQKKDVPAGICAVAVAGLTSGVAIGSIEMTWSNNPVNTSWNDVLNWVPPGGELPSVPDTLDEAAYIKDYGGVPTTITLDISPTIDYLDLENPQATLHLGGRTLSLAGPGVSSNAGLIVADPGLNTISGSFWNLGDIEIDAGGLLIVNGPQVQNTGVVLVNTGPGSADSAVIRVEGNVALGHAVIPGGELVLNGTETQPAAIEIAPLASLTNLAGHAIRGYGFLQGEVTNEGVIEADPGAKLDLTCNIFINRGTTSVTSLGGSTVHVQDGTVELSEELTAVTTIVDAGGTLTVGDLIFNNGGSMTVDGTLSAGSGVELMNGGELNGSGSVQGDVLNSSGTVAPGSSVGMIDVGSYTQQGGGRLVVELGGTQEGEYDVLSVVGVADLAGELEINAVRGFVAPSVGQAFTILVAQGGIADGDTFDVLTPEWGSFSDSYDYGAGTVTITVASWPECVVEDVNRDGEVGINDFLQMLAEWGPCPPGGPCPSDVSGDLVVDVVDFLQLLEAWGETCW
ncbi:MAG: hypothetical protein ACYTES_16055 [Planctomycetota bacterium]